MDHISEQLSRLTAIRVVMVNTTLAANIGAAARALKTMGLTQLVLVAPRHFPSGDASAVASGAADLLERAVVVDTLAQALADCTLVIGTSARLRSLPWPNVNARQAAQLALQSADQGPVALVFGREDRGLTNEELALCHYHLIIPTSDDYAALNVAAAIQVVCHELRMAALYPQVFPAAPAVTGLNADAVNPLAQSELPQEAQPDPATVQQLQLLQRMSWDEPPITHEQLQGLQAQWLQTLTALDFFDPDQPRLLPLRLSRLLSRLQLDRSEYNLLRGMLRRMQAVRQGTWPPPARLDSLSGQSAKTEPDTEDGIETGTPD